MSPILRQLTIRKSFALQKSSRSFPLPLCITLVFSRTLLNLSNDMKSSCCPILASRSPCISTVPFSLIPRLILKRGPFCFGYVSSEGSCNRYLYKHPRVPSTQYFLFTFLHMESSFLSGTTSTKCVRCFLTNTANPPLILVKFFSNFFY